MMFIKQILNDNMLWIILIVPLLAAVALGIGIPYVESLLFAYYQQAILVNYYLLFDIVMIIMTPYMFCFVSALVVLTERDENMLVYTAITPIGKNGYIFSRLGLPMLVSIPISLVLLFSFDLTTWNFSMALIVSLASGLMSVAVALFIISFSHNRVEGLAMGKLSGLLLIGLFIPFFIFDNSQYLFSLFPSFWIAKLVIDNNLWYFIAYLINVSYLLHILYRRFLSQYCK